MFRRISLSLFLSLPGLLAGASSSPAQSAALQLEETPHYGIYFDKYEPTFYTGFAPRTLDPKRLHLHIGRGNQLRATVVLSDEALGEYGRDLLARQETYRSLIQSGRLVPTQNDGFAKFERALEKAGVARVVSKQRRHRHDDEEVREENLELLEELNPGRVFSVRIPLDRLIAQWRAGLQSSDATRVDDARRVELLNALLPTRIFARDVDPGISAALAALVRQAADPSVRADTLRPAYVALLERVSGGIYPVRDERVEFIEFTAIYPIGTWNQTTKAANGRPIPEFASPGRRRLMTHQRTKTEDHIPDVQSYSWFPWLPYQHVDARMHNALHTLFWQMKVQDAKFLPPEWKQPGGQQHQYLWLLSRGQMSHGCTHVNGGHISELRQILPSRPEDLAKVELFYNGSHLYDVFDIDGDLAPEVMGVKYFIAYSLAPGDKPDRLRVRNERGAYYDWLYAGDLRFDEKRYGVFPIIKDSRYVGASSKPGKEYSNIRLYEADYEPEKIQFYKLVDIPFAQALRKVGLREPFPGVRVDVAQAK